MSNIAIVRNAVFRDLRGKKHTKTGEKIRPETAATFEGFLSSDQYIKGIIQSVDITNQQIKSGMDTYRFVAKDLDLIPIPEIYNPVFGNMEKDLSITANFDIIKGVLKTGNTIEFIAENSNAEEIHDVLLFCYTQNKYMIFVSQNGTYKIKLESL